MKKIFALATVLFTILLVGVCAQAADFEVKSTIFKSGDAFTKYSGDQIEMVDGNTTDYTFRFIDSGFYPTGLTLSTDGKLEGTPTSSGYYTSMLVEITKISNSEKRVAKFSIRINPKNMIVKVSAPTVPYDGFAHKADVTCYEEDGVTPLSGVTPIVMYGTQYLTEAVDAGSYVINVFAPAGYSIVRPIQGDDTFVITPLSVTDLSVTDYSEDYSGNPIAMPAANISVTPAISYEVEYAASGSSAYTTTAPTASGVYNVRVHTTEPNYETVYAYATLTINAEGVVFTVTGYSNVPYDSTPHYLNVSANPSVAFTYEYKDAVTGATVNDPTDAGTYNLSISLTDSSAYSISGIVGPTTLVITPQQVKFTVPSTLSYTGGQQTPTVTTDPVIADTMYDVSYTLAPNAAQTYVQDMGTYDVSFTFKDEYKDNYAVAADSSTSISVAATAVDFTVAGNTSFEYDDGISHTVTLTPSESLVLGTDYNITYTKGTTVYTQTAANENGPSEAGTYTVDVVFPANSVYSKGDFPATSITIAKKTIKFTIDNDTISYDGQAHTPVISTTPNISSSLYTVSYQQNGSNATVQNVGTYDVVIAFTGDNDNNYQKSNDSVSSLSVTGTTVNFDITSEEFTYGDGQNHVVSVTPSETLVLGTDYNITYKKGATVYTQTAANENGPSDAGTYTVDITILNNGYTRGTVSAAATLKINPVKIYFTVTGDIQTSYDGNPHTTTVDVDYTDPAGRNSDVPAFSLTYQKGSDTPSADMTDAGVYSIIVAFDTPTDNYIIDPDFNATYTINTVTSMNYGNSPAAMIYKDTASEHDDTWKADAVAYLTANRKFGTYLPTGFESYIGDITYPLIGNIDIDSNPYTVLVSGYDLSGFTDPGMVVDGNTITGSSPVLENSINGLYKVTYTDSDTGSELGWRYVVLVNRIGDANANKMVNAIDANVIEEYVNNGKGSNDFVIPNNAIQARTWDVTKDGKLNADDYNAIRNRFRTPLVPYYSWIEN